jgi:hypothetical protein
MFKGNQEYKAEVAKAAQAGKAAFLNEFGRPNPYWGQKSQSAYQNEMNAYIEAHTHSVLRPVEDIKAHVKYLWGEMSTKEKQTIIEEAGSYENFETTMILNNRHMHEQAVEILKEISKTK